MKLFGMNIGSPPMAARRPANPLGKPTIEISGGPDASTIDPELLKREGGKVSIRQPVSRPERMFVPATVTQKLCALVGDSITNESELETLRQLQAEYDRIESFLVLHLNSHADQAWWKAQQDNAAAIRDGRGDTVDATNSWTREDWRSDYQQKRKALKDSCRNICAQALPIAFAVADRIAERAAKVHTEVQAAEVAQAKEWGIEYAPSRLARILAYVAAHQKELVNTACSNPPRAVLNFAGIKL